MKFIICRVLTLAHCLSSLVSQAQSDLLQEFSKIQEAYKKPGSLSFSIAYLYSTQQNPSDYKDSVAGHFKIRGQQSWSLLNNTEYITNSDYQITLYPENNMIMLDKASMENLQFFNLDSLFKSPDKFTITSPIKGQFHFTFLNNPLYQSADLFYDPETYLLQRMKYLMQPSTEFSDGDSPTDGLVQMIFSNYSTAPFDETIFSSKKYIVKKGKEYVPAPGYAGYSVYLTSSTLLN